MSLAAQEISLDGLLVKNEKFFMCEKCKWCELPPEKFQPTEICYCKREEKWEDAQALKTAKYCKGFHPW